MSADEAFPPDLTPVERGAFGAVPGFRAKYTFGWSQMIDAAEAEIAVGRDGERLQMDVWGKSTGLARALWRLDARHLAWIDATTLQPGYFWQEEIYANRTITTKVRFLPERVWRQRVVSIDEKVGKWKRMEASGVFDILGGLLFVRSQPLADGDEVRLVVYPGDSPFLAEVEVAGRETITVLGEERPAIRLTLRLRKIEVEDKRMVRMVEHTKFRGGTVWVSDDELRVPLRAEVEVFVGYIHGELVEFTEEPDRVTEPAALPTPTGSAW